MIMPKSLILSNGSVLLTFPYYIKTKKLSCSHSNQDPNKVATLLSKKALTIHLPTEHVHKHPQQQQGLRLLVILLV